jgi:hypothetical protein
MVAAMESQPPLLRIMGWFPPPVTPRYKVRQLLWAFVRVQLDDPKPAIYAVNPAGDGMLLFRTDTHEGAEVKLALVGRELDAIGLDAFCERYRIPLTFVEALEPPKQLKGLRRFRPMV